MNIEELLRTSSADIAAGVVPPDVKPTTIRNLARRRTRLRAATVGSALVAAALVAALVVVRPGDRDAAPAPVPTPTPTPKHTPLRVHSVPVWGDSEGVHVGDRTYPLAEGVRLETLAVTANGVVYADRTGRIWFQPRRGDAVEIGRAVRRSLAAGPSSTKAVWAEDGELVVFDTRRLEEVGRAMPPGGLSTGGGLLNGNHVNNQAPFYHVSDDHAPGINASSLNVIPRERPGDTTRFAADVGRKISLLTHVEDTGIFNVTGTHYATVVHVPGDRTHIVVVDTGSGRSRRLTEDSRLYPIVGWGRGEILMVWRIQTNGPGEFVQLLACDVRRATCRTLPIVGRPVVPNG